MLAVAVRQEITKSFLLPAYVRRSKNGRFRHFLGRMRTPILKFLAVSHVLPGSKYGHLAVIWNPDSVDRHRPVTTRLWYKNATAFEWRCDSRNEKHHTWNETYEQLAASAHPPTAAHAVPCTFCFPPARPVHDGKNLSPLGVSSCCKDTPYEIWSRSVQRCGRKSRT